MKLKRNIITPYLTFLFLVVGLSGILMFFHLFDDYTKVVHELLGVAFVLFSILHTMINWKSLKSHFKHKIFIVSGMVVLLLSVGLIMIGKASVNHEKIMIEKLVEAPISMSFEILDLNYGEVEEILEKNNIVIGESTTIKEIGMKNKRSSKEIIELIIK